MTDATGRSTFGYDSLGRMVASTNARGQKLGYGYDLGDQLTSLDYPDALTALNTSTGAGLVPVATGTVRRGYDADGYLTSVADWRGNTTSFAYDPDGNLARTQRPNATATTLTSDANGMVTELADVGVGTLLHATTPRTDEGLLASTSELGATGPAAQRFDYDGAQRLSAAGPDATRAYGYDAADNPTKLPGGLTQSFDAANQLTTITAGDGSTTTLGYDSNGNRRSSTKSAQAQTSYGYDQADQLTSYQGPDRAKPGQTASAQYAYDATGLRHTKTVDNIQTTQAWDRSGALPLVITDGPSAYITGPDGRPIEQIAQDGTVRYYHHDAHGSTRALTNQTATVVATYTYDAYGNQTSPPTSAHNPFTYDGQYTDPETALQYLRARYYDPTTAQFLTRDPLTHQSRAPYTYANNSPTNYSDPTGLISFGDVIGAIGDGAQAVGETGVGALDGATFGATGKGLDAIGIHINRCSGFYRSGTWAPIPSPTKALGIGVKAVKATKGGKVYKVGGDKTPSGKPYVGRTKQPSPASRGSRDGRDRSDADIVDGYDEDDLLSGRVAEQQSINREGGVDALDNKRNEMSRHRWDELGIDP